MAVPAGSKGIEIPRPSLVHKAFEIVLMAVGAGSKGIDPPRPTKPADKDKPVK